MYSHTSSKDAQQPNGVELNLNLNLSDRLGTSIRLGSPTTLNSSSHLIADVNSSQGSIEFGARSTLKRKLLESKSPKKTDVHQQHTDEGVLKQDDGIGGLDLRIGHLNKKDKFKMQN